jgi:hypothetical protein
VTRFISHCGEVDEVEGQDQGRLPNEIYGGSVAGPWQGVQPALTRMQRIASESSSPSGVRAVFLEKMTR